MNKTINLILVLNTDEEMTEMQIADWVNDAMININSTNQCSLDRYSIDDKPKAYIICYATNEFMGISDTYQVIRAEEKNAKENAFKIYNELKAEEKTHSASICAVIESTDY